MSQSHSSTITRIGAAPLVNRSMVPALVAGIAVTVLLAILFVWTRQRVLNLEYDIASLESGIRNARQQTSRLQIEKATFRQPAYLEQLARDEFGLTMPDPRKMIVVR